MGWSWKGWFRKLSCVTKGDLLTSSPMLNHDPTRFWVAGLNWKDKSRRGITWWESQTNALRGVGWTHSSEEDQADDIQNLYRIVIYQKGKPLKRVSENAIWQRSWRLSNNCWRPNLADISIWYISLLLWDMPDESRIREIRSFGLMRRWRLKDLCFTLRSRTEPYALERL